MMAVTAGVAAYSVNKIKQDMDEKKIPLMGSWEHLCLPPR